MYVHSSSLVFAEVLLYLGESLDLPSPIPANKNTQVFLENVSIIYIPLFLYIIPELHSLFLSPCYHTFLITSHSRIGHVVNHASILTPYTLEICLVKKKKEERKNKEDEQIRNFCVCVARFCSTLVELLE